MLSITVKILVCHINRNKKTKYTPKRIPHISPLLQVTTHMRLYELLFFFFLSTKEKCFTPVDYGQTRLGSVPDWRRERGEEKRHALCNLKRRKKKDRRDKTDEILPLLNSPELLSGCGNCLVWASSLASPSLNASVFLLASCLLLSLNILDCFSPCSFFHFFKGTKYIFCLFVLYFDLFAVWKLSAHRGTKRSLFLMPNVRPVL